MAGAVTLAVVLSGTIPAAAASAAPAVSVASTAATAIRLPAALPGTMRPRALVTTAGFALGNRISCGSPTACLAVGANTNNNTGATTPLAEALSGKKWKSVSVKTPAGAANATALAGVSCKTANYCLVVGDYATSTAARPYALTWNGSTLTPISAPPVPKGGQLFAIASDSCVAVKKCVVVGSALVPGATIAFRLFTDTWNGAKWTEATAASPSGSALPDLTALHCFSTTSCVAAGTAFATSGATSVLVATWNGKTWTREKATTPAGALVLVNDLSCVSAKSCAAAGMSTNSAGTSAYGFLLVWNGKAWSESKYQGPKGDTVAFVLGVSCVSASNCVAVGAAGTSKTGAAAALSWNGKSWTALKVPAPAKGDTSDFEGVSCPKAGDCVAVGEGGPENTTKPSQLAGYWNGKSWQLAAA
jgi:hypothetical protein